MEDVKFALESFGDNTLLNDCLFENYNSCTYYFDDNLEKSV